MKILKIGGACIVLASVGNEGKRYSQRIADLFLKQF